MKKMNRRHFLQTLSQTSLGLGALSALGTTFSSPALALEGLPSRKLNIAHIGVGGMQAAFHLGSTTTQNRVAFCDVDDKILDKVCEQNPGVQRFNDFREMFDQMGDQIDGTVITTPDHIHAFAALEAMKRGIHCYCEKPLAHDVYQIRLMQKLAKEKNLKTQMGIQIHAGDNYRRVVELIKAGTIGSVRDVHVWCNVVWGGKPATTDDVPCPDNIHWDLWIGSAPERPYQPCYFGGNWRSFWDFGNGGMGDMACHYCDLPFWALDLGYPISVDASALTPADADFAARDLKVRYEFAPLEGDKPLTLTWYDGVQSPKDLLAQYGLSDHRAGVLFLGDEGALFANYTNFLLLPQEKFAGFEAPAQQIPPSIGHHAEWFKAILDGDSGTTTCNFDYAGRLAETVLLGPVSYRCGQKLDYDAANMVATNCPAADAFLRQEVHNGWAY